VSLLSEETYLQWLVRKTPTRWWHDSANPDEIDTALSAGAQGVTTNPVLTYGTLNAHPDYWKPYIENLPGDLPLEVRAEALLKVVATAAAKKVEHIFKSTGGLHGYALGQLNPSNAGDAEKMLLQARRVHSWAPNIAVKLPATKAGVEVIEYLAAEGIPICATINVSVAQAVAVAESYEKGAVLAVKNGIKPPLCLVVQQIGRLDDYIRDVSKETNVALDESDIIQSGIAVAKRSYEIFKEKKYQSIIMPAGLRGTYHLTEMAGAAVTYTLHPRLQKMIFDATLTKKENIDKQVDKKVIERLMKIPEFVRAYEPDGLKPREFIAYGLTQRMLSQFLSTGWALLETYGSTVQSSRWT
jgi:transaldolase